MLALPVLLWIAFYSFTKRFTALCHVFLGGALAASPLAAAIAMDPTSLTAMPALWWLAGMVVLWVGGFDVIYALQDVDFDRTTGLHSIPARLGPERAIWVSRAMHAAAAACLVAAAMVDSRFGIIFPTGVGMVLALLVAEHVVLAKRGKAGLEMAFFTLNGVVSCLLGAAGILDLLL
jgi:4-hydroxybenzoate polyprenyltransferase